MKKSTLKKDKESGAEPAIHPLLAMEIRTIRNWCEWLSLWQAAKTVEERLGLLHVGFTMVSLDSYYFDEDKYDEIDRLIFYFNLADGWTDRFLFEIPEDGDTRYYVGYDKLGNRIMKTPCELRQELAQKAFNTLCLNYFSKTELFTNGRHGDEFCREWESIITSERFFPIIQRFFRAKKERIGEQVDICNLSRPYRDEKISHNEQQAVQFLLNLARFLWEWKEPNFSNEEEEKKYEKYLIAMRVRIDTAKPWMVEILSYLDRLDVLRKWMLELDSVCLVKLKEIALRNKLDHFRNPVAKDRPAASLDEACYLGSKAAWFLKEYELKTREHKRLTGIAEAERQIEEAGQKIKKLSGKK